MSPRATALLVGIFQAIDNGTQLVGFFFAEINRVLLELGTSVSGPTAKAKKAAKKKGGKKLVRTTSGNGTSDAADEELDTSPHVVALWRSLGLLSTFLER